MRVDQDLCPPRYRDPVRIARGGMGELYRAVDEELGRPVAVKLLAARYAGDKEVRARFRREALAAARLSGEPNTVAVFDVGEWRGTPFIVMEYLAGGTLEDRLRHGAQPPAEAIRWLEDAARSLDAAHRHGIVHRDVKPANLLLDDEGRVRVGDFGIATAAGLDSVTVTGTVLGTAGYLAPEQAQGRATTAATDEYALAVVAFELATGRRPFARDSSAAEAAAHCYEPVPSAVRQLPTLPGAVDGVFARALAKDPSARFPSSAAFVTALAGAWTQSPSSQTRLIAAPDLPTELTRARRRRSRTIAGAGLALLAASGAAGLFLAHALRSSHATIAATTAQTIVRQPPTTTAARAAARVAPAAASDLNTRGYRLMLAGDYTAALPLLRLAVAGLDDPRNLVTAYANFNLGQTLVRLGQCDAAIPSLRQAALLEPSRGEVRAALAFAALCAGTAAGAPSAQGDSHGHGHGHHYGRGGDQSDQQD
jgi:serine/threonine-protein kinase